MTAKTKPLIPPGKTVATPACLEEIEKAEQSPSDFLTRHQNGDWGELCDEDRQANELALENGDKLLSVYKTKLDAKIWCITEWDRSVSTLLLPVITKLAPE